ncbi:MAG: sensor histidine kinase [Fibrobacterota bacterium]|nr:sensor histidine kinase [Fibrobacterota bacterium]QQS05391.1 MAG: sensor histidine kinase [Fibrobacterota bacterium]
MLIHSGTYFLVPKVGQILALVASSVYLGMIVECLLRSREYDHSEYRARYIALIFVGMVVISVAVFVLPADYVLYLPILMGILFFNVNTILKSEVLRWAIVAFMATPFLQLVVLQRFQALEYFYILLLFVGISVLSNKLFHVNATTLEASERQATILRQVFRMANTLTQHDVRNELQKMQVLATARFRQDPILFLDTLSGFTESIEYLVDTRPFESRDWVIVTEILDRIVHLTDDPSIEFSRDLTEAKPLWVNRNILYSVLKNLLDNSIEAARKLGSPRKVRLVCKDACLRLEDECGGFPLDQVGRGISEKRGQGHGIFLQILLDPTSEAIFGFKAEIANSGTGTRVTLRFPQMQ